MHRALRTPRTPSGCAPAVRPDGEPRERDVGPGGGREPGSRRVVCEDMAEITGTHDTPPLTVPVVAPPAATEPDPTGTHAVAPLIVPVVLGGAER